MEKDTKGTGSHPASGNPKKRVEKIKKQVDEARKAPNPADVVGSPKWHELAVERNKKRGYEKY